jgi:hypothetical protein
MNIFSVNNGTWLGILIVVGCASGLLTSELLGSLQANNGLQAAQLQLVEAEACPYPPQTPAAAGEEGGQSKSLQPQPKRQPTPVVRQAIYMELLVPSANGYTVSVAI